MTKKSSEPKTVEEFLAEFFQRIEENSNSTPTGHGSFRSRHKPGSIENGVLGSMESIELTQPEEDGRVNLALAMRTDLRFEHLDDKKIAEATWNVAFDRYFGHPGGDESGFLAAYERQPQARTCNFWVLDLWVPAKIEALGVTISPAGLAEPEVDTSDPPGSVISIPVVGTDPSKMRDRAQSHAEEALKRMRIVLDKEQWVTRQELLFSLSHNHWFSDGGGGWRTPPDAAFGMHLDESQVSRLLADDLVALPIDVDPSHKVQQQINIAIGWLDRATFATDPMIATLYRIFAFEALFTKRKKNRGGLARLITRRRATLGLMVEGGVIEQTAPPRLYKLVRSEAVHGEAVSIDQKAADRFGQDARRAVVEYIRFVMENGFTQRHEVLDAIDNSPNREVAIRILKSHDPTFWADPGESAVISRMLRSSGRALLDLANRIERGQK